MLPKLLRSQKKVQGFKKKVFFFLDEFEKMVKMIIEEKKKIKNLKKRKKNEATSYRLFNEGECEKRDLIWKGEKQVKLP